MTGGLRVAGLGRRYGPVAALAGIDMAVAAGTVTGLLGPNGAGKTTAIECIAGLTEPDTGTIHVDGIDRRADPAAARARMAVVLQRTGLLPRVTPAEAVRLAAVLHCTPADPAALLDRFGLADKAHARVETLSGGQRQRLALAVALVGRPALVLLDEPGAGLDAAARRDLQAHVRALAADGAAVLLATHDMDEAERVCDRVAILHRGRIVAEGPPADLAAARGGTRIAARASGVPAGGWPARLPDGTPLRADGSALHLSARDANRALAALVALLDGAGQSLLSLRLGAATLDEMVAELAAEPLGAAE